MADMTRLIKSTKPSTSLATLEKYNQFKIDYERRSHPELMENKGGPRSDCRTLSGLRMQRRHCTRPWRYQYYIRTSSRSTTCITSRA